MGRCCNFVTKEFLAIVPNEFEAKRSEHKVLCHRSTNIKGMNMREKLREWVFGFCQWIAILGIIYLIFLSAGYGWYNGKSIASLQDNVRILEAYIEKKQSAEPQPKD